MKKLARTILLVTYGLDAVAAWVTGFLLAVMAPDGGSSGLDVVLPTIRANAGPTLGRLFFTDLRWIGIAMWLLMAIPSTLAVVALVRRWCMARTVCAAAAVSLLVFCGLELAWTPNPAVIAWVIIGIVQLVLVISCSREQTQ